MMKKYISVIMVVASLLLVGCRPSGTTYSNPLTYTDIPDNDVIRVGEDYYMVSTTMYFCPGAPIMHSRDLVHWRIVSYIYDLLEDDAIYRLQDGNNAYGAGQWATSFRYHDGVYYALFVSNDQKKSYLYRTRDLVNGPWERTVFEDYFFHDPGLLFDEERLFVVYGNGDLRLAELSADGSKVVVEPRVILSAPSEGWGLRAEGAHFYHIGDYYYILEIDWPVGDIRQATCWRSRSIWGPYESKVVLKGALDGRPRDGIAQGPIVDTQKGDWYAIQFQDHGAVGRIPTLQPVRWEDGWPMMGEGGRPLQEGIVNLPEDKAGDYVWSSDEFDASSLALVWQWNHKDPGDWSLSERPGWLQLKAHPGECLPQTLGTLTQRTVGPRCISEVRLDASALEPGSEAGLCAFQSRNARIGLKVKEDGSRAVVLTEEHLSPEGRVSEVVYKAPFEGDIVYLRIRYVFTPVDASDKADTAFLSWSADGENWTETDYVLPMQYTLDFFTGYRSGLYCMGAAGTAAFDYFHQWVY
jgi:beta-xylosidase